MSKSNRKCNLTASTKVVWTCKLNHPYPVGSAAQVRLDKLLDAVAFTGFAYRKVETLRAMKGLKPSTVTTALRHGLIKIAA